MKKILFILLALTSCALNYEEVNPSKTTARTVVDYTGNLIDEWVANRGYVINNLVVTKWSGETNATALTPSGVPIAPQNGIQTFDSNDCFKFSTVTNPGFTGALSAVYRIRKGTASTTADPLLDNFTNTPNCKFLLRISNTNAHIGISYNGVIYDTNSTFPYGSNYHVLTFRVDGTNAGVFLDSLQIGNTFSVTGGPLVCNTGKDIWLFKNTSGNFVGACDVTGFRLYNEYLSDSSIGDIYNAYAHPQVTVSKKVLLVYKGGQSNNNSPAPDNAFIYYPDSLKGGFSSVNEFNWVSNANYFFPIPANTSPLLIGSYPVGTSVNLALANRLSKLFPDYEIRFVEMYKAATALYDTWNPSLPSSLYNQKLKPICREAYQLTTRVEQREVAGSYMFFIQGENDANDSTMSRAYYSNLQLLASDFRSNVDPNAKFIIARLNTRMLKPYGNIVMQAQNDFVASDTVDNKIINTDDAALFPMYSNPPIHYMRQGEISLGECAGKVIFKDQNQ